MQYLKFNLFFAIRFRHSSSIALDPKQGTFTHFGLNWKCSTRNLQFTTNPTWFKLFFISFCFKGILYYSTWASDQTKGQIMLAWMDGTHRNVFVDVCVNKTTCTDIQWPSSLTIDHIGRKLYWCDPRKETIERIDLNGKNREVIVQRSNSGNLYPYSMVYHNHLIFFTDILSGNIMKVSLQDDTNRK